MAEDKGKKLEDLRERLYARPPQDPDRGRSDLSAHKAEVEAPKVWQDVHEHTPVHQVPAPPPFIPETFTMPTRKRNRFRMITLVGGGMFFVIAAILASTYLFFGKNSISGNNITLEARGPFTIGGGDTFDFTVSMTNQNAVPIEAATLIIEYPFGTKSSTEAGKDLPRERRTIERLGPGEVYNIPLSAIIYGEENQEKQIRATIEYRVQGSNATFYRDAEPLNFKISSSPITLLVEAVEKITSGQEVKFQMTLVSNSPSVLEDLVVKAEFPFGFDYSGADPEPVAGEDTWRIASLKPEEKKTITLRGVVNGKTEEKRLFKFSAGAANERDPYILASILSTKQHEISMEQAFVDLGMTVNGKSTDSVVGMREPALFDIAFQNTLGSTIYGAVIEVTLSGNAFNEQSVASGNGFYDSNTNTITWDATSVSGLREIAPGKTQNVSFSLTPYISETLTRTPQVSATVSVKGKRVSEAKVSERLTDTVTRTVKVASAIALNSESFFTIGPFANSGPTPPIAEETTTYTAFMAVQNGSNAVSDGVVESTLPQYVKWTDQIDVSQGTLKYNASTRQLTWTIGDIDAGKVVTAAYQVSLLPSVSQVGTIPALVTGQRFRANDRFTGSVVRANAPDLSTQLNGDPDSAVRDGRVLDR